MIKPSSHLMSLNPAFQIFLSAQPGRPGSHLHRHTYIRMQDGQSGVLASEAKQLDWGVGFKVESPEKKTKNFRRALVQFCYKHSKGTLVIK